jgi:hypothetical protein
MSRTAALALAVALAACTTPVWEIPKADPPPADWMRVARVAGAAVDVQDDEAEWALLLDEAVARHASVIEADSSLSDYQDDARFDTELAGMRRFAKMCHDRNLKVVWYFPSLEVITPGGEAGEHSMYKDHPDWVQQGLDETPCDATMTPAGYLPNVFYGSKAFWVDPGAESAWMCHLGPWRQVYMARVKQIAATGLDGLWLDVPLFNDIVGRWACNHERDRAKFRADTGLDYPEPACREPGEPPSFDPTDPVFRTWIQWRHTELDAFLKEVLAQARTVTPDFNLVVETVTMDYNAALFEGLDGAFAGPLDGYWHVWEVDVLSDTNSMINGRPNDWASLTAMYKFGRGADAGRAAWAFTYGTNPDDAEAVMMTAVAAQVNPYELKSPEMTSTVGLEYRGRVFGWIEDNQDDLFRSTSAARVAILHSSASRDAVDLMCTSDWDGLGACGVSLFDTWQRPDPAQAFWTDDGDDSVRQSRYLAEYRGVVKALSEAHVPFDVLPARLLTADQAAAYDVLVAPNLAALSDGEAAVVESFAKGGGTVVFTGSWGLGGMDERGIARTTPAFDLDFGTVAVGFPKELPWGGGSAVFVAGDPGKATLLDDGSPRTGELAWTVGQVATPLVRTTAGTGVHLEAYRRGDRLLVQAVNRTGADGDFGIAPQSFTLGVDTAGRTVKAVRFTSARTPARRDLPWSLADGWIEMQVDVEVHGLVIVEFAAP